MSDGKPGDLAVNRRLLNFKYALNAISPAASERFFNVVIQSITTEEFKLQPEWGIHPPPSILCQQQTVSGSLISSLETGSIISKPSISTFVGPKTVEFTDGTTAQADVMILCTGFHRDFSFLPELQPAEYDEWSEKANSDGQPLPRLFQNIFPHLTVTPSPSSITSHTQQALCGSPILPVWPWCRYGREHQNYRLWRR
jgi:dimethylaniline monooxygenase (N-oxide forming)